MRQGTAAIAIAAVALGACNQTTHERTSANSETSANTVVNDASPAVAPSAKAPREPRTSLAEPKGAIDPKSAEAAGQVVQSYGALIEQRRWTEANSLWSDATAARKFQSELSQYPDVHLEIGNLGDPEGAAGSIYITDPVVFYGKSKDGKPFRRSADIILRRVNDVPGSTEAQRRWHIERIDWTAAG
jgi:hypothetical protein